MSESFIHLRLHSIYSLLEGAMQVKKLPSLCAEARMPAVAITDSNNLFGALEFSETAAKAGVQPIIGCQLDLMYAKASRPDERAPDPLPIVCIAQSERGYMNLMELSSLAYLEAGDAPHHVTVEALEAFAEDVICLTGGALGPLGRLVRGRPTVAAGRGAVARAAGGDVWRTGSMSRSSATAREWRAPDRCRGRSDRARGWWRSPMISGAAARGHQ